MPKEKKGKGKLLIVGGVVLVGGAVAALLLLGGKYGSINISSIPAGGAISLDGTDTGLVTPALIDEVDPGSHSVGVQLDGYVNYSEIVNVQIKQTANVDANLTAHSIAVTSPRAGDVWVKNNQYDVIWTIDSGRQVNVTLHPQGNAQSPVSPSLTLLSNRTHNLQRRIIASQGVQKNAERKLSYGCREYRAAELNPNGLTHTKPDMRNPHKRHLPQLRLAGPGDAKPMDIANVKIVLIRGNSVKHTFTNSTTNDGFQTVTAPAGVPNADDYTVKVICSAVNSIFGMSEQFWVTFAGDIQCNSTPPGAKIILDGVDTGFTTNSLLRNIPVGSHTVKFEKYQYKDWEVTINVTRDTTTTLNAALMVDPIPKLISPASGAILDNGRFDGQDDIIWDFDWSNVKGATKYHLYVKHVGAKYPVIDWEVYSSSYHHAKRVATS